MRLAAPLHAHAPATCPADALADLHLLCFPTHTDDTTSSPLFSHFTSLSSKAGKDSTSKSGVDMSAHQKLMKNFDK